MAERGNAEHLVAAAICAASKAVEKVPIGPGYYAIFIDDPALLGGPFHNLLVQRETRLIYIGIATRSLHSRLVNQDLRHHQPSTFFRGIGAILGYRPSRGSLVGRRNQNNYQFGPQDTDMIINWMEKHLSVSWVETDLELPQIEKALIRMHCPVINTTHNPSPVKKLAELRRECRTIAKTA